MQGYIVPPSVIAAAVALVAGAANVNFAVSGALQRYRVIGWSFSLTAGAPGIVDMALTDIATGTPFAQFRGASVAGGNTMETIFIPYPGIHLSNGSGAQLGTFSTLAGGQAVAFLYYYIDNWS